MNVLELKNFFVGDADRCERLIACAQYCAEATAIEFIHDVDELALVLI
jgi:hypothetical protein